MQGSNFDRAKQFLPFDALNGFREELYKRENKVQKIEKIELCGESLDKLENKFSRVKVGKKVEGIFFKDGKYLKFKGTVTKINYLKKVIYFGDEEIFLEDISEIKVVDNFYNA